MSHHLKLMLVDVRSAHNVGAIWRSAEAFGVTELLLCGLTPYPRQTGDKRLPHVSDKATAMINKTSLGTEKVVPWRHFDKPAQAFRALPEHHFYALETTPKATPLTKLAPKYPAVLIVGNEVTGLPNTALDNAEAIAAISMKSQRKSINVAVATGIALFELTKNFKL